MLLAAYLSSLTWHCRTPGEEKDRRPAVVEGAAPPLSPAQQGRKRSACPRSDKCFESSFCIPYMSPLSDPCANIYSPAVAGLLTLLTQSFAEQKAQILKSRVSFSLSLSFIGCALGIVAKALRQSLNPECCPLAVLRFCVLDVRRRSVSSHSVRSVRFRSTFAFLASAPDFKPRS